jgi:small subunit ribosomal protein S6
MRYYETLYLINPNLADDEYSDVVTKFKDFVEKNKGVIVKVDEWGKKTLAYAVKKFDKGYYVLLSYCGEPDLIALLKREFKLDERIIKYQTVKLSDSEDPEALKQKSEAPVKIGEEAPEKVGEEAPEKVGEEPETSPEAISEKEGENGVQ